MKDIRMDDDSRLGATGWEVEFKLGGEYADDEVVTFDFDFKSKPPTLVTSRGERFPMKPFQEWRNR